MGDLHPVVRLLLARMESHPEEFASGSQRWQWVLTRVRDNGSKAEIEAIDEALRPIRLNEAHEWVMDELLNGDERRKREELDRQVAYQQSYQNQARMQQLQGLAQQNAYLGNGLINASSLNNLYSLNDPYLQADGVKK